MSDLHKAYDVDNITERYWESRFAITKAYREYRLYVLTFLVTDEDREDGILKEATWSNYTLPAFCVQDANNKILMIWTRKDWRRQGVAKMFTKNFEEVWNITPESKGFWERISIRVNSVQQ